MKEIRISASYNTKDFKKMREALFMLLDIDVIIGPSIRHAEGSEIGTFEFMMAYDKLEYANEDHTGLITVEK